MTTISLLVLDFLECIASIDSYKFMSYTKMLYKLIRNSLTNSCLNCIYMINKNKHHLMYFLLINSMLQFKSKLGTGHICFYWSIMQPYRHDGHDGQTDVAY
jgi:hypothetical protein